MILIYISNITPRFKYVARFIFDDVLQVSFDVTTQWDDFLLFEGPKINYSLIETENITIFPDAFLTRIDLSLQDVSVVWQNGIPLLFHQCGDADLPFDPFSATFYMISRYEEYVNQERDGYGRFQAHNSIAHKHGFLEIPVVDYWAAMIRDAILNKYPDYQFPKKDFRFIPTVDIDIAFAYKGRSIFRSLSSTVRNLFNPNDLKNRWNTLILNKPDPFDTFQLFHQWHRRYNLKPIFFIHTGKYGRYDRSIPVHHPLMHQLINQLDKEGIIGIHPSYHSNNNSEIIRNEINTLTPVIKNNVYCSRQHFLKFDISSTYQVLADCGIKEEYSMGYAEFPGFRAGTCTPFHYYNLLQEKETGLKVYPFTFMDGTWINYLQVTPEIALERMTKLIQTTKNVNGTLISIWHNHTLSEIKEWKNWQTVYHKMLEIACQ